MKIKQGVSLIVLVITIIVMVILAGAIVLTLNNSGIIAKAGDAVKQTNLATAKEVASMAWAEAYASGKRSDEELEAAVTSALADSKITEDKYEGYTLKVTSSGVEFVAKGALDPRFNHNGIIPDGATYIRGWVWNSDDGEFDTSNEEIFVAGDAFPEVAEKGDIYRFEDYQYVYGLHYDAIVVDYQEGNDNRMVC